MFAAYIGLYTSYMISFTGNLESMYFTGLSLAALGSTMLLPWNKRYLLVSVALLYGPSLVFVTVDGVGYDFGNIFAQGSISATIVLLCLVIWYQLKSLRFQDFLLKNELKKINKEQEKIIAKKTKENIFLNKLSNQFSEETIHLVMDGELDINKRVKKNISTIFVDIENSTFKANLLDYKEYLKMIDEFISMASQVLRKNNITVSSFLGDGIMAFANAPLTVGNHSQVAMRACLEILENREKFNSKIKEKWQSDFNIRIGITTGDAYVGFYPSDDKGVYSATGSTVNLASRLCDMSYSNCICVDQKFLELVKPINNEFKTTSIFNTRKLKGFEKLQIDLYSVNLK